MAEAAHGLGGVKYDPTKRTRAPETVASFQARRASSFFANKERSTQRSIASSSVQPTFCLETLPSILIFAACPYIGISARFV